MEWVADARNLQQIDSIKNTSNQSRTQREEDLPVVQTRSDKKKKRGRKREGGYIGRRMAGTRAVKRGNEGGDPRVFAPSPRARREPGASTGGARREPG